MKIADCGSATPVSTTFGSTCAHAGPQPAAMRAAAAHRRNENRVIEILPVGRCEAASYRQCGSRARSLAPACDGAVSRAVAWSAIRYDAAAITRGRGADAVDR